MQTNNKLKQPRQAAIALAMPLALAGMTLMPQGINAIPLRSGLVIEHPIAQTDETFAVKNGKEMTEHQEKMLTDLLNSLTAENDNAL